MRKNLERHFSAMHAGRFKRHVALGAAGLLSLATVLQGCDWNGTAAREPASNQKISNGRTIGLVLADFNYMFYETEGAREECPDGLVYQNMENWEHQFPTESQRKAHLKRCGSVQNRGPNCENVWFNPDVIDDPLPFREVRGKISYGADLDGGQGAGKTAATCAHEEFTAPDGRTGIDNQYYRFMGCEAAVKGAVKNAPSRRDSVKQMLFYRILLEITGVDDERNDDAIELTIYKGRDPLVVDAAGKAAPWQSQRIDSTIPEDEIYRLRGRIVDGVVVTEPADVVWAGQGWTEKRLLLRGMTLRVSITDTGAEALILGYIDVASFWESYSRSVGMQMGEQFHGASGPAVYDALHRLADGYKDPKTGACTALSFARNYQFVRARLVHPVKRNDS